MSQPFIYKYEPQVLSEFELDTELRTLLQTLQHLNHMNILFVGDSGSGKTSLIQALIREYFAGVELSKYNDNVLIINNLKEQGIAYYRSEVKTFCQTASIVPGRKKILVLDDLDLINEQSQQVFRNCVDKFSHNVHFLGSCSNTQKVIESMQSRMTIIRTKVLTPDKMHKIIRRICDSEAIQLDAEAEQFIMTVSNHSVRTVINYLEKFKLLNCPITLLQASAVCTNISFQDFANYTTLCQQGPTHLAQAIELMYKLFDRGYSVMDILDNYFLFVKTTTMLTEEQKYRLIPLLCKYIAVFQNVHEDDIELALFTHDVVQLL
jgi:replication factor C subunit 2/4